MAAERRATFGELLRHYRVAARLTQEALAERAGLSTRGIADLERGARLVPHPDTLRRLTGALNLEELDHATLAAAGRRPALPLAAEPPRLPGQLTSFIGREDELGGVRRLLGTVRLLTLTGFGGIGKTRLALAVAHAVADAYPDGVVFVELASVADEDLLPHTVASILGVRELPQVPVIRTLAAALREKRLLLVLDNCEHLVVGCAALADTLLRGCPQLRILTTSREPLGVGGEIVWQVPALSVPTLSAPNSLELRAPAELGDYAAVQLFAERARDVLPSFELTQHTAHAVAEVCVQLDGIALAIELAAARVRLLAPEQIAERLGDRLRLLATGSRTAPARHQALRAAIDWSYDLLTELEKVLLQRLSVFAGGWTLEAAEAVCGGEGIEPAEVLDLLGRLVDKSLVQAERDPNGIARYRLLETLREYAGERLRSQGDSEQLLRRHGAWYTGLACHGLEDFWWGVDLLSWLDKLARDQANFRAVLRRSLEVTDAEQGMRLAGALWVLWSIRGSWAEGTSWLASLLALPAAAETWRCGRMPSSPPACYRS
jgi:non-specific serine/threonine protein kinase